MDFSPKQLQTLKDSTSRFCIYEGAVRSGKSYTALWKLIKMAREAPPGSLAICGKSQATIKRNIISELQTLVGDMYAKYSPGKQELLLFDRTIDCIGAVDERSEGRIRGSTYSGALVDEATLMPEGFFKMLSSRLSRDGSQLIATTNPDSPFHWLKKDYIDRANELDLKVFQFKLADNPSLSSTYIDNLKKEYRGLWYKRFILGEWCLAEGAIYDFFDDKIHIINREPSYAKYWLLGIDYGTTNPFAAVLVGFNDDVSPAIWVAKEYYFSSKGVGYQKTDADYAVDVERFISGIDIKKCYLDPSAASFRLELKRRLPKLIVDDANNDVNNGIRCVATHLSQGNLKIHKDCKNLISEMYTYSWDSNRANDGVEQPRKVSDHCQDALRYAMHTHFGERKNLKEVSQQERDLYRWQKMSAEDKMKSWGYRAF